MHLAIPADVGIRRHQALEVGLPAHPRDRLVQAYAVALRGFVDGRGNARFIGRRRQQLGIGDDGQQQKGDDRQQAKTYVHGCILMRYAAFERQSTRVWSVG